MGGMGRLLIIIRMNRCHSCKNTRRQLLMLKCSHDTCIKCAADNYFVNCKNKPSSKKPNNVPLPPNRTHIIVRNVWTIPN